MLFVLAKGFVVLGLAVLQTHVHEYFVLFGLRFCVFCIVILWLCGHLSFFLFPVDESEHEELEENPQGIQRNLEKVTEGNDILVLNLGCTLESPGEL